MTLLLGVDHPSLVYRLIAIAVTIAQRQPQRLDNKLTFYLFFVMQVFRTEIEHTAIQIQIDGRCSFSNEREKDRRWAQGSEIEAPQPIRLCVGRSANQIK